MDDTKDILQLLEHLQKLKAENKLAEWKPVGKQFEYLNCKAKRKAITAGNQVGKSATLLYEEILHATGLYPVGWEGIRYNHPVNTWIVGETTERVRDTIQKTILGDPGQYGTGFIPLKCLGNITKKPGTPDAVNKIAIKHISGGFSTIQLFSYVQGREDFQGSTIDRVAFDEEPPEAIHNECKIRVIVKDGHMCYAFTPLRGRTPVWDSIESDPYSQNFSIAMDDMPWMTPEKIESLLHGMSDMEKRARRFGIPATGGGQIFQFEPYEYSCQSFEIPEHWPRIGGLDIGYNHPTGAVGIAWDRDTDCLYVYQEYKAKEKSAGDIARTIKHWGIGFATSHDAFNRTVGRGERVADVFKDEGLEVFSAGKDPWARIEKTRSMIADGRLYIFKDKCPELMKEMLTYHTVTSSAGKLSIRKIGEDLCLSGNTQLITRDGVIRLSDMVGMKEIEVLTPIGWCKAYNARSKGTRNVVTSRIGRSEITHTPDHTFMTEFGFDALTHGKVCYAGLREELREPRNNFRLSAVFRWCYILYHSAIGVFLRETQQAHAKEGSTPSSVGTSPRERLIERYGSSPFRPRQVEQFNFKSVFNEFTRPHVHACVGAGEGRVCKEEHNRKGNPSSYCVPQECRGLRDAPQVNGGIHSFCSEIGAGLRNMWRKIYSEWAEVYENHMLKAVREEEMPCSAQGHVGTQKGTDPREDLPSMRGDIRDIEQIGKVLLPLLSKQIVENQESAGQEEVFDITIDVAHCFFDHNGVIIGNCDAFTHAVSLYEKAEIKGRFGKRKQHVTVEQWKPADKKYGV